LNLSQWVRQIHRWLSIAFTVAVIINGVAVIENRYTTWLGLSAVALVFLMMITGLYLFVLPYANRLRSRQRAN
jgi:uncharacterized iron-regulated membrane protein